jgi:hypothetical protein
MLLTEPIESTKPTEPFVQALQRLRNRKQQEALIKSNVQQVYEELITATNTLLKVADTAEFVMSDTSHVLSVAANGSTLTVVPVDKIGLDSKLANARGMFCGLILFFLHQEGEEESHLYGALRIYPDGFCSDGNIHWVMSDGADCAVAFMAHTIAETLVNSQFYWSGPDDTEQLAWKLPVVANRADVSALPKCFGFECALPH